MCWLDGICGRENRFLTSGFSKSQVREVAIWDNRKLDSPATRHATRDSPDEKNVLNAHWDESSGLLFLLGKGDKTVMYYSVGNNLKLELVGETKSKRKQLGYCFSPKRKVNIHKKEILRGYKLENEDTVQPMSFCVPTGESAAQVHSEFRRDLYPHCYYGVPSLTADEWLSGENAAPIRGSLDPKAPRPTRKRHKAPDKKMTFMTMMTGAFSRKGTSTLRAQSASPSSNKCTNCLGFGRTAA